LLILYNGNIFASGYTNKPSAIAIQNGIIIAIGSDKDVMNLANAEIETIDLAGRFVLPGFTDAHIHLQQYALQLAKVDCETPTKASCLERIHQKAKSSKPGEWILGHGWNHNRWSEGYGSIKDLDRVAPNHPVFLTSKSLHAAWVNSKALEIIQKTDTYKTIKQEQIQTDHNGNPTGIFFEETIHYINDIIPNPSCEQLTNLVLKAQEKLIKFGITAVHDFDPLMMYDIYSDMQNKEQLILNIIKHIPFDSLNQAVSREFFTTYRNKKLSIGSIKLFADGALGTQTAHMLAPFENTTEDYGMMILTPEEIIERGMLCIDNNFSIAIHAIGDKANRQVLDAYQALRDYEQKTQSKKLKHRIEHVQLIHPSDQSRLAEMDIVASMQPVHIHSDIDVAEKYWGERSAYAYPFNSLAKNNTKIIFGSDAPVESPNPFLGLHAASYRKKFPTREDDQAWHGNEKLALVVGITGFSTDHSEILGSDFNFGTLKIGYNADLMVLDKNPLWSSEEELLGMSPVMTMIEGKWIGQA